jgi:uncharacterized protein YuzE
MAEWNACGTSRSGLATRSRLLVSKPEGISCRDGISTQRSEKGWCDMKVSYDGQVDAVYIELLPLKPDGVIEVADGINIDVTAEGKVVGIEFLNAKKRVNIDSLLSYEIEADSFKEIANL